MKIIGVIPARYGSTRFPGKPLKFILGKPLLQWVIEGTLTSMKIDEILVATDHKRIFDLAISLGVKAVMTDSNLASGSDRVWAAVKDVESDIIVNIQGDEPLINGELLDQLIDAFIKDSQLEMSTLGREFSSLESLKSVNTAKIILNQKDEAIYFSRFPIPYTREQPDHSAFMPLKHIGIYAYRTSFLKKFCEFGPCSLEKLEGLEQLRALYLGAKIKVVRTEYDSWGVDTPEDVIVVEDKLRELGRK